MFICKSGMKIPMTDYGVSRNSVIVGWAGARPFVCLAQSTDVHLAVFFCSKVCLFELTLNVPVNGYGNVGTLPPFYGTCTQN